MIDLKDGEHIKTLNILFDLWKIKEINNNDYKMICKDPIHFK